MAISTDPLPHIPPALLNSADIQAYQAACELIEGKYFNPTQLKAASFKILSQGTVYWCDEDKIRREQRIEGEKKFVLPKNGIAFISPDVRFSLPDFIAARFNLTIPLVHKGLLLGTGPLIDPGFQGRLLIPLHNLTTSDVELTAESGLIWVEFTKLSPGFSQTYEDRRFRFVESFKEDELNRHVSTYFDRTGGVPTQSSLHDHVARWDIKVAEVERLQGEATKQQRSLQKIGWGALFAIAISMAGMIMSIYQVYAGSISVVQQAQQSVVESNKALVDLQEKNKATIDALTARIEAIEHAAKAKPIPVVSSPAKPNAATGKSP